MSLQDKVRARLESSTPEVIKRVEDTLVEKEVASRHLILLEALGKSEQLQKAIYKIKPDQTTYDQDGVVLTQSFTKAKVDERKKLLENQKNLNDAIDKIIQGGVDFEGLKKASDKVNVKDGGKAPEEV